MKIEGLNLDDSPITAADKSLTYAKNIRVGEDKQSYKNIHALKQIGVDVNNGSLVECGWIEVATGIVIFYHDTINNPIKDHIKYYEFEYNGIDESIRLVRDIYGDFNFDPLRFIHGTYYYNYDKELIIAFSEGNEPECNESRIINVTNPFYNDDIPTDVSIYLEDSNSLNIIPDFVYDTLGYTLLDGGNLKTGSYQFAIRYKILDGSYTDWSILTPAYKIIGNYQSNKAVNVNTNKAIRIYFTTINSTNLFKQYQIGVVFSTDESNEAYHTEDLMYNNFNNSVIIDNLKSLNSTTIEDIFIKSIKYIKDSCIANFNNRLYRGNVSIYNYSDIDSKLQTISNNVSIITCGHTVLNKTSVDKLDTNVQEFGFQSGEYYAFYIGYIDRKGYLINIYNCRENRNNKYVEIPYITSNKHTEISLSDVFIRFSELDRNKLIELGIKSYVVLYIKHDENNSRILSTCPCVRDMDENNLNVDQHYYSPFNGANNVRVYPFEILYNRLGNLNCLVRPFNYGTNLYGKDTDRDNVKIGLSLIEKSGTGMESKYFSDTPAAITVIDSKDDYFSQTKPTDPNLAKLWYGEGDRKKARLNEIGLNYITFQKPPIRLTNMPVSETSLKYIPGNNSQQGNMAGESHYRAVNSDINFNDDTSETYVNGKYMDYVVIGKNKTYAANNSSKNDRNPRFNFVELLNNQDTYYSNTDNANLQIASPIISVNRMEAEINNGIVTYRSPVLVGDRYSVTVTLRLTAPIPSFVYGDSEKQDRDSNSFVIRWILTYTTISSFNLNGRYNANAVDVAYKEISLYNQDSLSAGVIKEDNFAKSVSSTNSSRRDIYNLSYEIDNLINGSIGQSYNLIYNSSGIEKFLYGDQYTSKTGIFKSRIIRSNVNNDESKSLGWRTFDTNDYKEANHKYGAIVSLKNNNEYLYIQQEQSLIYTAVRDVIGNSEEGQSYVSSSDLFQREFKDILYSNTGFIGCVSEKDTYICKNGYIVIDARAKRVYLVSGNKAVAISDIHMKRWFKNNINILNQLHILQSIRYITADDVEDVMYIVSRQNDLNYCISYDFKIGRFVSFFDRYKLDTARVIFQYKNGLCRIGKAKNDRDTIFRINDIDRYEDSILKIILNKNTLLNKHLEGIVWKDTVSKYNGNVRIIDWDKTISKLAVHTDDQCTGYLNVVGNSYLNKLWYDTNEGVNKIGLWFFNNLQDVALNNNFLTSLIDFNNDNLKSSVTWFDKNDFYNQYFYVIIKYEDPDHTHEWSLEEIDFNTSIDNRNQQLQNNGGNQQENK